MRKDQLPSAIRLMCTRLARKLPPMFVPRGTNQKGVGLLTQIGWDICRPLLVRLGDSLVLAPNFNLRNLRILRARIDLRIARLSLIKLFAS